MNNENTDVITLVQLTGREKSYHVPFKHKYVNKGQTLNQWDVYGVHLPYLNSKPYHE